MKIKHILIISLLLTVNQLLFAQNLIEWSEDYQLQAEDFLATAPNSGIAQTICGSFYLGYEISNYEMLISRNLNHTISCYFQKDASYIDKGDPDATAGLLKYQQLQFNLNELEARILRKKLVDEKSRLRKEGIEQLHQEASAETVQIFSIIEKETNHGSRWDELDRWQIIIAQKLDSLSTFCKTCTPYEQVIKMTCLPADTQANTATRKTKIRRSRPDFWGIHSYYVSSGEIIPVRTNVFKKLLADEGVPTVALNPGYTLANLIYMRNWLFTSLSYSYTYGNWEYTNTLTSKLSQYSIAARFGYNLIKEQNFAVSPYIGFRYTRFRHLTRLSDKKISLDDYLTFKDIDLRVSQFSGAIGINSSFLLYQSLSVGFYAAYLIDLSKKPIVRSEDNRISVNIQNPLNHLVIGLGLGFGSHN